MNLRSPSVTASTQTSAFNAIAFQSPVMPNARMSLCTQSVHFFSFPPRPLRTASSRFPNMIRFGNRPLLIRRSVSAHKSLLARNVVSMLSHRVISRARLYKVIRWSGLLRCAPMMRSKPRYTRMFGSNSFANYFLSNWYALEFVIILSHVVTKSGTELFALLSISKICNKYTLGGNRNVWRET